MVYIAKNFEESTPKKKVGNSWLESILNQISPRTALYLGLATSVMTICTIGFVVLLWIAIK